MQTFVLVLLIAVLLIGFYSFKIYRTNAHQRAREKRRNLFNDRV